MSLVRHLRPRSPKPKPKERATKRLKKVVKKARGTGEKPHIPKPVMTRRKVEQVREIPEREQTPLLPKEDIKIRETDQIKVREPKSESHDYTDAVRPTITTAIPKYHENPKPHYPLIARRRGYHGLVILKVQVMADGEVGRVELRKSSGYSILDRSAIRTVKKWRFIPGSKGNIPISMWVEVPIRFELRSR